MKAPVQSIKSTDGKVVALVRAKLPATALRFHVRNQFTCARASQEDLIQALAGGVPVQDATGEPDDQHELPGVGDAQ